MARLATPADEISLHEGTIVGILQTADAVSISIELASWNRFKEASIHVTGAHKILRDGIAVNHLAMESEDGEVLSLQCTGGVATLLVEWNDFGNHRSSIIAYRVECDSLSIWI
jgi:hypothetical protein